MMFSMIPLVTCPPWYLNVTQEINPLITLRSLQIILIIIICQLRLLTNPLYVCTFTANWTQFKIRVGSYYTIIKVDDVTKHIYFLLDGWREGSIWVEETLCAVQPPLREPQPRPQETLQPGQGAPHTSPGILAQQTAQARPQVSHHRLKYTVQFLSVLTFMVLYLIIGQWLSKICKVNLDINKEDQESFLNM